MYTTLNKIREFRPCESGWTKLLSSLNKNKADDEPLALSAILDSNGVADTIWCFRAVDGLDREKRLFAVACAREVQHLLPDQRSINALDVVEKYANGLATKEELDAAAYAAADAADAAAYDATRAADIASYFAARAADAAAVYATRAASVDAAYYDARKKQEETLRSILKETEKSNIL